MAEYCLYFCGLCSLDVAHHYIYAHGYTPGYADHDSYDQGLVIEGAQDDTLYISQIDRDK